MMSWSRSTSWRCRSTRPRTRITVMETDTFSTVLSSPNPLADHRRYRICLIPFSSIRSFFFPRLNKSLWSISDDKRHGLKEVASLDLVIEGTGKKGIDVSISVSPFPPPVLPHISTAISRVHTKNKPYADLVADHVTALTCQFYHPQRYLKVTRPLGVDYIGEIEIEAGKSIHGESGLVA